MRSGVGEELAASGVVNTTIIDDSDPVALNWERGFAKIAGYYFYSQYLK
jgi:hypothetical protein